MKLLEIKPQIHKFDTCREFAEFFNIGEGDFILTNEYIYKPSMGNLNLKADVVFQERYGSGEPSNVMINSIMSAMHGKSYKRIIAIGGGTVIDICKLLSLKCTDDALDLFEKRVPIVKDKELIIVPTTCGTGSEVTNVSIAEIKEKHTKMGLAVDELYANYAVLIPELVKGLPFKFFVTSSIDALIHAIESYVSPKANVYTELYSVRAIELILKGYMQILKKGEDYRTQIIEDFVIGSNYAGIAFGNAGVGAVHALSYPLGGSYHVPHGEANYQMFIEVFKTYYKKKPEGKIKNINRILANILNCDISNVYESLSNILDKLLARKPLREYGMKKEEIQSFTDSVISGQQRLLVNNYVPLSREEIVSIYKNLF
ncbi:iron-containing alcohol dehydrogenase [Clostridium fermenticellae]|uniref:Iron-containing alcohol dehydrogenase n=1 Tax=Clostridium fermenticellae TaxID=2068654 RepID=A0A386H5V9_9CLOT|nr:4-hydroxybutyrate dehydrogenase [Clostridium fermenticellae]AYD41102.1 iron-containing alcohol dehydrogenase [Clostridium fermenticellae]